MRARGFVFSLDAFVAFVLIMITVNLLIFTIGTPKPYYTELESAHILAHDTLQVLATSGDIPTGTAPAQTYLERILRDYSLAPDIMRRVAGGNDNCAPNGCRPIIPKGYGYMLQYLNLDSVQQPGTPEDWKMIYDAGNDTGSDRYGMNYTKLQASATTFLSLYLFRPMPGESPFCHAKCTGYEIDNTTGNVKYAAPCDTTPCNITTSNFRAGNNTIRVVRLIVYT